MRLSVIACHFRKCGDPYIHFTVVGQIQVVGQISGMEVSVDSIIKKPFCSRNYDKKLETAKAKKPTLKLDNYIKQQIRLLKKTLDVGSSNRIKLLSTSAHA